MKKLKCKLIVSDFDGTLANTKNGVDEQNIAAINSFVAAGGIFAVCTGRILSSIMPRVKAMGLTGLVVASQGSVIADIATGKILRNFSMSPAESAHICKVLEEESGIVQAYCGDGFYSSLPKGDKHLARYEEITGVSAWHTDIPLSQKVEEDGLRCQKISTMCYPKDQAELFSRISARLADKFCVTCSANVLIEICPLSETKGAALKFIAKKYNIPLSQTCAVGDNLNDLSMIEVAGYGVAVANASPLLKEKTKYITSSCDECAISRVIDEFGYENA